MEDQVKLLRELAIKLSKEKKSKKESIQSLQEAGILYKKGQ